MNHYGVIVHITFSEDYLPPHQRKENNRSILSYNEITPKVATLYINGLQDFPIIDSANQGI